MYDVNVFVYGTEGEDLSFSRICNKEELNELLKCYDKNDLNVKEIPNAKLSESMETCFCPYCMKWEFIIRTCKECGRKYFIKFFQQFILFLDVLFFCILGHFPSILLKTLSLNNHILMGFFAFIDNSTFLNLN